MDIDTGLRKKTLNTTVRGDSVSVEKRRRWAGGSLLDQSVPYIEWVANRP